MDCLDGEVLGFDNGIEVGAVEGFKDGIRYGCKDGNRVGRVVGW